MHDGQLRIISIMAYVYCRYRLAHLIREEQKRQRTHPLCDLLHMRVFGCYALHGQLANAVLLAQCADHRDT